MRPSVLGRRYGAYLFDLDGTLLDTAPDIMGQGKANPTAMILSTAMMLDWLADKHGLDNAAEAAERLELAVDKAYANGIKPTEFGGSNGTADIAKAVLAGL